MNDEMKKAEVSKIEETWKKFWFENLAVSREINSGNLSVIRKSVKRLNLTNEQIIDPTIYINNKLVDLMHAFNKCGLSFFATWDEQCQLPITSFVGSAIAEDLFSMIYESINLQSNYCNLLNSLTEKKRKRFIEYESAGIFKKIYLMSNPDYNFINKNFFNEDGVAFVFSDNEVMLLQESIQKLIDYNEQIYNYNLEDKLVSVLLNRLTATNENGFKVYSYNVASGILEDSIKPCLIKLGYNNLIQILEEELSKEFDSEKNKFNIFDDSEVTDELFKR